MKIKWEEKSVLQEGRESSRVTVMAAAGLLVGGLRKQLNGLSWEGGE